MYISYGSECNVEQNWSRMRAGAGTCEFPKYMNLCRTEINMRKLINGSLLGSKVTTELSNHQITPVIVNIFTCTSYCRVQTFMGLKFCIFF